MKKQPLSKIVARERSNLGYSYDDLSRLTNRSKSYLWEIEQGKIKNPSYSTVKALSEVLNFDIEAIAEY